MGSVRALRSGKRSPAGGQHRARLRVRRRNDAWRTDAERRWPVAGLLHQPTASVGRSRAAGAAGSAISRLPPGDQRGPSALVVRPDGIVTWASDTGADHDDAADALRRWFGDPIESGAVCATGLPSGNAPCCQKGIIGARSCRLPDVERRTGNRAPIPQGGPAAFHQFAYAWNASPVGAAANGP